MGVALLAEGVDRNSPRQGQDGTFWVALLAEGVDRNTSDVLPPRESTWSPSSRRAWIEMMMPLNLYETALVALLAEGVDRNGHGVLVLDHQLVSPSSRRAWIEID